jgi:Xaa-Pro aminopeptidase
MELLTHAIQTTAEGLVEVMKAAEPGMNEKDFELILKYKFAKAGCENLGFGIQAASGPSGTSVHYGANDRDTEDGDMMVFDVGARYGYYTADISRSFPVNGKFTKEQKEIYSLVLKAQKAAIAEMKPGVNIGIASQAATEVLNHGLAELGLITDLGSQWQKRFWIQHGFFHHIGLVVHDVGGYSMDLEPGMIITMEPGLYFPEDYLERASGRRLRGVPDEERKTFLKAVRPVFKKYINIGVRIEDDVYITEDGNKIISIGVPKEINDIEKLMKETSMFNK